MFYYYFDPTYVLVLIGLVITIIAQIFVSTSYSKYKKIKSKSKMEGFEVARKILDENGLKDVGSIQGRER